MDQVLASVELSAGAANRRVGAYSLGMRQRLFLAAALLGDPPVMVLDEPANGLDPQGVHTLRDLLRSRAANGGTVLVSSHVLAEVEQLADDVVVIDQGCLIASGPIHKLQQPASLVRTPEAHRLRAVLEAIGATVEPMGRDTLIVRQVDIEQVGQHAYLYGIALHELSPVRGSLEELFLEWTSGQPQPERHRADDGKTDEETRP